MNNKIKDWVFTEKLNVINSEYDNDIIKHGYLDGYDIINSLSNCLTIKELTEFVISRITSIRQSIDEIQNTVQADYYTGLSNVYTDFLEKFK